MSKTIKIPEYKNPFTVVINNTVYQYGAGETVEVPDEVAEAIKGAIELEPKAIPSGYSKIATVTVKVGANGTLPGRVAINEDDNGKPFRVKDFFLKMKLAHTITGVTTAKLLVRGMVDDVADTRCSSGHCTLSNLSKGSFTQYYARLVTCGKGGGGILMVSKEAADTGHRYGTTPHFTAEIPYMCPTEPDVSLEDGMNTILAVMLDADSKEMPFAEGSTIELWGVRV